MDLDTTTLILEPNAVLEEQIKSEESERKKLAALDKTCIEAKVTSSFVVITDDHPGNALCKAARDHKIDCIILGRRELGAIKRLLTSSTSKYCIDHADCNVLVFKKPYQVEEKQGLSKEEKVQRQMASEGPTTRLPGGHRILTLRTPAEFKRAFSQTRDDHQIEEERKVESAKDLELVHQLEEQARVERIKGWKEEKDKERTQRNLERTMSLEKLRIAEEQERAYRIRKQEEENTQEQVSANVRSREDRELTKKMEEEEKTRRILEDQEIANKRKQESKEDLAFVVALEEEERKRRAQQPHPRKNLRNTQ